MEPAKTIISKLGGPAVVAGITGTSFTAPYRWQHPVEKGGCAGRIPQKYIPKLLEFAHAKGIELTLADFFAPRPASDSQHLAEAS